MTQTCPRCKSQKFSRAGNYFRKSDSKLIARFCCRSCGKKTSQATSQACYKQKKRRLNPLVKKLLCSGVSQRRCALILGINRKTVARKLSFLGLQARLSNQVYLRRLPPVKSLQLDDLITIEHTKCKPLTVSVIVENKSRKILAAKVSPIPAFGHLAKLARRKYGYRKNQHLSSLDELFTEITSLIKNVEEITSDDHKLYPKIIKKYLPRSRHITHKSLPSCVAGQGELKKTAYDPLFSINHTLAMFRANINRLIRRTWCTTKLPSALQDHIDLYIEFHNKTLTA